VIVVGLEKLWDIEGPSSVEIIGSTYLQSVESNLGVSVQTFEDKLDHLIEENILRNFVCEVE
jgi:hypothetical protein